ncbi:MAG: phosphatase [Candidatus Omnitrophota bacterium]|nr:phosphatase [Candidatus Omnitrophota bacterium]MDZ4242885.1 phosphatase [Candidatus Omnitrophota bacterium]
MSKLHFVLDVDGVLTTGQFLYSSDGKAYKVFGPHDADGLKMLRDKVNISFISADHRGFGISKKRADDMGYPIALVLEQDRHEYMRKTYGFENLIFMGDGIFDVPILKDCLFGIAPAGARKEARKAADFVTESGAGGGAVLDACQEILKRFFKPKRKR